MLFRNDILKFSTFYRIDIYSFSQSCFDNIFRSSFFAHINVNRMLILRWGFFLKVKGKSDSTYHIAWGWGWQRSEDPIHSDREVDKIAKRSLIL